MSAYKLTITGYTRHEDKVSYTTLRHDGVPDNEEIEASKRRVKSMANAAGLEHLRRWEVVIEPVINDSEESYVS